jgi:hypothetical protein
MEQLRHSVGQAHEHTPIGCVLADAEFDSERNHTFCREQLLAQSIIRPNAVPIVRHSVCASKYARTSPLNYMINAP